METYTEKTFNIPELVGISKKNIEEHLALYSGYIKHANLIQEKLNSIPFDETYIRTELQRRFSFEYCGIKNHELYFQTLSDGPAELNSDSKLSQDIVSSFGSMDNFWNRFNELCLTRGIGWAVLSYDMDKNQMVLSWTDEQHLGNLTNNFNVYMIDMWEHSYVGDYWSSGKKKYIEDYIKNSNFKFIENRYESFLLNLKP